MSIKLRTGQLDKNSIRQLIELITNKRETVIWDKNGYPNIMYVLNNTNVRLYRNNPANQAEVTNTSITHPAFLIDNANTTVDTIYVSKYRSTLTEDGVPVSLPGGMVDLVKKASNKTLLQTMADKRTEISTKKGSGWKLTNALEKSALKNAGVHYYESRKSRSSGFGQSTALGMSTFFDHISKLQEVISTKSLDLINSDYYNKNLVNETITSQMGLKKPSFVDNKLYIIGYFKNNLTGPVSFNTFRYNGSAPVSVGDIISDSASGSDLLKVIKYTEVNDPYPIPTFKIRNDGSDYTIYQFCFEILDASAKEELPALFSNVFGNYVNTFLAQTGAEFSHFTQLSSSVTLYNKTTSSSLSIDIKDTNNSRFPVYALSISPSITGEFYNIPRDEGVYFSDYGLKEPEILDGVQCFSSNGSTTGNMRLSLQLYNTRSATPTLTNTNLIFRPAIRPFQIDTAISLTYALLYDYSIPMLQISSTTIGNYNWDHTITSSSTATNAYPLHAYSDNEFYNSVYDYRVFSENTAHLNACQCVFPFPVSVGVIDGYANHIGDRYMNIYSNPALMKLIYSGNPIMPPVSFIPSGSLRYGRRVGVSRAILADISYRGFTWIDDNTGEETVPDFVKFLANGIPFNSHDLSVSRNNITNYVSAYSITQKPAEYTYRLTYIPPVE